MAMGKTVIGESRSGPARLAVVAVLWLLAAIGLFPGGQPDAADEEWVEYRLGSGDRVRVTVFGHEDLSGELEVDGAGQLSLPLVQQVRAAGLTVNELEEAIRDALKPDYLKNPRVSVEVLNYRPFYILGEVKNPGSYPYVNGMTVINAVALAGGYTYRARQNKVTITRATDAERTDESADHDTVVLPGDVIMVPERYF
jgi:polysaccharide export outer membrane protein